MAVRSLLLWLVAFVAASAVTNAASGVDHPTRDQAEAPFAGVPIIGNLELVKMRGGLVTPFGLEIEFSVLARTLVDGQTVLSSAMSFGEEGAAPIGPAALSSIERVLPGFSLTAEPDMATGGAGTSPQAIDVSTLVDGSGVVFRSAQGLVAGLARIAEDQALNLIVAAGLNQQIEQQLNLIFSVTGFAQFQADARAAIAAGQLIGWLAPP